MRSSAPPEKTSRPKSVVLDSNVIVAAAIYPEHTPGIIFSRLLKSDFECYTSPEILEEIERVLLHKAAARISRPERTFELYREHAIRIDIAERIRACTDPDDDKFLECAVAAKAEFIVSGDQHLVAMKRFRGIRILSPQEFLSELAFFRP